MAHFNIDLAPIVARAKEVDILHVRPPVFIFIARVDLCMYSKCILRRHPIKDFDPLSLRKLLGFFSPAGLNRPLQILAVDSVEEAECPRAV